MESSKSEKKTSRKSKGFNLDPKSGKAKKCFTTIKKVKATRLKDKDGLANLVKASSALEVFNGEKINVKGDKEISKAKIQQLLKARDKLQEFYLGCARSDQKEVNNLANNFLTKDEIELAELTAEMFKQPKYVAKIVVLLDKIKSIEKSIENKEIVFKAVDAQGIVNEYSRSLKKEIMDIDEDEESSKLKTELDNILSVFENPDEAEKIIGEKLEDKKEVPKEKNEIVNEDELKEAKKKTNDELMKYEEKDDEFDRIIESIKKGDIKLDVVDKERKTELFAIKNKELENLTESAKKELIDFGKRRTFNFDVANQSQLFSLPNKDCPLNFLDSLDSLTKMLTSSAAGREVAILDYAIIAALRGVAENVNVMRRVLEKTLLISEKKKDLDKDIQAKALKGKNNTQIKKVLKNSYIPESQWKDMTSIQKSMKQIKDWDQFPRANIWRKYNDEEKKAFFKERIGWNNERMNFLMLVAKGDQKNSEVYTKKYGWDTSIDAGRALVNQLYYADKYVSGTFCTEFKKLYLSLDKPIRVEFCKTRAVAKEVITKLAQEKKLTGFVYRKKIRIPLNNVPYWEMDLDKIADDQLKKNGELLNFIPRGYPRPRLPYTKKRVEKKGEEDKAAKEESALLGRKRGF